ncbi:hypothetical protein EVAR_64478_1 [Eumeta japonica]|uniref:Uncharacterized protein n=1 Tax=Eumeta variegata TaxID=151549 RepID=A0A4C1ZHJ1_EUMVA|nr:hypothetical protein EVAR_64478_1 [Eumeta japonica]
MSICYFVAAASELGARQDVAGRPPDSIRLWQRRTAAEIRSVALLVIGHLKCLPDDDKMLRHLTVVWCGGLGAEGRGGRRQGPGERAEATTCLAGPAPTSLPAAPPHLGRPSHYIWTSHRHPPPPRGLSSPARRHAPAPLDYF